MALKFRLKGLAETFIEEFHCPECGLNGTDQSLFSTEFSRVTFDGIVIVAECAACGEVFVPNDQKLGIIDPKALRYAVEKDACETGEVILTTIDSVMLCVEHLNAVKRGEVH